MAVRIQLTSKVSFEDFKKVHGKHFQTEAKAKDAYDKAVKALEKK